MPSQRKAPAPGEHVSGVQWTALGVDLELAHRNRVSGTRSYTACRATADVLNQNYEGDVAVDFQLLDGRYALACTPRNVERTDWVLLVIDCDVKTAPRMATWSALFDAATLILGLPRTRSAAKVSVEVDSRNASTEESRPCPTSRRPVFRTSMESHIAVLTIVLDTIPSCHHHLVLSLATIYARLRSPAPARTRAQRVPWDTWAPETRYIATDPHLESCAVAHFRFAVLSRGALRHAGEMGLLIYEFDSPAALRRDLASAPQSPAAQGIAFERTTLPKNVFPASTAVCALPYRFYEAPLDVGPGFPGLLSIQLSMGTHTFALTGHAYHEDDDNKFM